MPEWARQLADLYTSDGLVRPDVTFSLFGHVLPIGIGDGRHAVYRAQCPDGSQRVLKEYAQSEHAALLKEARLLRRLRHPFVLEVEAVVWNPDFHKVYLVLPFCAGGSLRDAMRGLRSEDAPRCRALARQVPQPPPSRLL
jgi:serine/threonine protein kinase